MKLSTEKNQIARRPLAQKNSKNHTQKIRRKNRGGWVGGEGGVGRQQRGNREGEEKSPLSGKGKSEKVEDTSADEVEKQSS